MADIENPYARNREERKNRIVAEDMARLEQSTDPTEREYAFELALSRFECDEAMDRLFDIDLLREQADRAREQGDETGGNLLDRAAFLKEQRVDLQPDSESGRIIDACARSIESHIDKSQEE